MAAVVGDTTPPKLTRSHPEKAYGTKVWGARRLHAVLITEAEAWMVLLSSTSAFLSSPGQAKYSAVNLSQGRQRRHDAQDGQEPPGEGLRRHGLGHAPPAAARAGHRRETLPPLLPAGR